MSNKTSSESEDKRVEFGEAGGQNKAASEEGQSKTGFALARSGKARAVKNLPQESSASLNQAIPDLKEPPKKKTT